MRQLRRQRLDRDGGPDLRGGRGRLRGRRHHRLTRPPHAVELEHRRRGRLVHRPRGPAQHPERLPAVRVRGHRGHRPGAHLLVVEHRGDRVRRRPMPLQERQLLPLLREGLRLVGVGERAHAERHERDAGRALQLDRLGQHRVGPRRLALEPRRERVERHEPDARVLRQRRERADEHVGLDRGLARHVERVVLRRERGQRLAQGLLRRAPRTPAAAGRPTPAASANSVHAPPDCSAAATPSVRSFFTCDSSSAVSNIVTGSSTSTTPWPRSHASRSPVLPASAPVCAMIDRSAASDRPSGRADHDGLARRQQRVQPATDTVDVAHRLDVAGDDLRLRVAPPPTRTDRRARARPRCRRRG